jgi:hypothetical protein
VSGLLEEGMGSHSPSVPGRTANARWADLQPVKGGPIVSPNAIDKAISSGVSFRTRLFMGQYSPDWALALGKVHVHDPTDGKDAEVVRWWETDVQLAQKDFVTKVALKYDGQIPLIFIANGGTIYAEPFIRGIGKNKDGSPNPTIPNLLDAGYSKAADQQSYVAGYRMFQAFKQTRVAQAFNPWQYIDESGNGKVDVAFTIEMMDEFARIFPRRAVWQNNSIRLGGLGQLYDTMYQHMKDTHAANGRPISFQTAIQERVGSFSGTLTWAVAQGAHAVELSPGYAGPGTPMLTGAQLASFNAQLKGNV